MSGKFGSVESFSPGVEVPNHFFTPETDYEIAGEWQSANESDELFFVGYAPFEIPDELGIPFCTNGRCTRARFKAKSVDHVSVLVSV